MGKASGAQTTSRAGRGARGEVEKVRSQIHLFCNFKCFCIHRFVSFYMSLQSPESPANSRFKKWHVTGAFARDRLNNLKSSHHANAIA